MINAEEARNIPLPVILDKLNCKSLPTHNQQAWYFSPFRNEKEPSFHVHLLKNVWYDFGEGEGGNTLTFALKWLAHTKESCAFVDALRWLENLSGLAPFIKPIPDHVDDTIVDRSLTLKEVVEIKHPALVNYLQGRGVPIAIGKQYLKQVRVKNKTTGKSFISLGWKNEDDGYELRNPFFKGCIGTKDITFIRGTTPKPKGIHLFEGMMDFLSVVTIQNGQPLKDDIIILNSLSCLKKATPYIKDYGYRQAYSWMDNDKAGEKAKASLDEFFKTQRELVHLPMNAIYASFKDVNEWHVHQLKSGKFQLQ